MRKERNEKLTQVGPGTPMGNLLRRYWQVVGVVAEFDEEPVRKIRILGEDLTLFRSKSGEIGLIGDRCTHRCMAMEYGIPDEKGLRCPYHGWLFGTDGSCLEQPFEDRVNPNSHSKKAAVIKSYPVEELSGLIFAYLGPQPAPLLPRWDVLVQDNLDAVVQIHDIPCNWLQCMDNALDPVHFEFLHGALGNYVLEKQGKKPKMVPAPHAAIAFDIFEYGIVKRRLLKGEAETSDDWTTGHPMLFPNILAVGAEGSPTLQFRVPVDDFNTLQFAYRTKTREPGTRRAPMVVDRAELFNDDGKITPDIIPRQDIVGWVGQGPITDRTQEHLGQSDKGIMLYRKMLEEALSAIEQGGDPKGVIRDKKKNEPFISLNREGNRLESFEIQYEDVFDVVQDQANQAAE